MAGNNAVGSLAVVISANAVQFDRTVTKVADDASNLHKRVKPAKPLDLLW